MLKPSLQLRLGQQLTMTPQLQQAIRLLQLPVMELQAQIQEALEANVMLESTDAPGETSAPEPTPQERESPVVETTWNDSQTIGPRDSVYSPRDSNAQQEFAPRAGETLQEHLIWQLEMESLNPTEFFLGQALVDAINDDGYLIDELAEIQKNLKPEVDASIEEIEHMLVKIQQLDPIGIGARSLAECLALQLNVLEPETPGLSMANAIVSEHLDLVAGQKFAVLRRRLNASEDQIEQAIGLITSLHPRPGAAVHSAPPDYVVPDVYVRKIDDRWVIEVNGETVPSLRVNQDYAGLVSRSSDHSVLRTQLQEARWLIRSLEIRNETLVKVAREIVERQHEFLDRGEEAMRPLVLRNVAEAIEMHESTISRVTTNKFMHTPRGIFEFRYFFSSHVGSQDGQEFSSTAIRAMIKKMIQGEDQKKPLSDSKIADRLIKNGINVARRTVAKYREAMSIPSSSERKRQFAR